MDRLARQGRLMVSVMAVLGGWACSAPADRNAAEFKRLETVATASSSRTMMIWPLHRVVNGHAVLCAYRAEPSGEQPEALIARGDQLYLGSTMGADRFDALARRLCGPHWVKPLRSSPVA